MVHNLECEKARALYSLMLDNMAELKEIAYVDSHLQECVTCHKEFNRWRRISLALNQAAREEVKAPPGFAQGVMAQLAQEKPQPSLAPVKRPRQGKAQASPSTAKWSNKGNAPATAKGPNKGIVAVTDKWPKQGLAIAAALLATIGATLFFWPNSAPRDTIVLQTYTDPANPQPGDQNPGTAANPNGAENTGTTPETQDKDPKDNKDNPEATTPENTPASENNTPAPPPITLFSSNVVIQSSFLSVTTADPVQAGDQVVAMAGTYGGSARTESRQDVDGKAKVVMSVSVPSGQSSALIGALSGLGRAVNSPQSQDITAQYQQALSRRQELLGLIQSGQNTSANQLEIKSLDRQIQDWNRQANTYSIVVTLNQS